MFAIEWFCFTVNKWIRYSGKLLLKDAEELKAEICAYYNPKRMVGFNPDFVRIVEV